jgi:hypothetical protein
MYIVKTAADSIAKTVFGQGIFSNVNREIVQMIDEFEKCEGPVKASVYSAKMFSSS